MIGKSVSHYKILEKLGGGGMGVVYKAEDIKLKRSVALKFLPPEWTRDEDAKARFMQEAQAASALDHNNICTIHEVDETEDGQLFIAMALYEGETLKYKIEQGPLKIEEVIELSIQIAQGLAKAHNKEIVHRDIKPANVFVTDDRVAKILDFGLAKLAGRTMLTKEGTTLGTTAYMSPEQARGEEVDHRTDVFSLGVLLYEMISGQFPFKGDYDQAVTYSILNEEPEPVTALRTGIPMELERIVKKCLKKDPAVRYQHADELIADLKELKKESETKEILSKTGMKPVQQDGEKPHYLLPAIIGLVIVVGIFGYWLMSGEPEVTERIPIAVVDFVNETNEPELNGLSGMLITALEQSRRLDVLSRARMFDELKKMDREEVTFIDESAGRAIAKNANIQALAIATIRKFDNLYTIDFKVMDPVTGEHLFTAREEGEGQRSILTMIDRLSEKTRIDLKEEEQVIQLAKQGIAEVTTTNLEAYHHYFKGEELVNKLELDEAQDELEKAIALDSTFALAYYRLAYAIAWFNSERAKEPLQKALSLIDRIPEKERYLVRAQHAQLEEGNEASLSILKEMERIYPDDKEMLFNIGDRSFHKGKYTQAAEYFERVLVMDPTSERTLEHLAWAYQSVENYDKMPKVARRWVSVTGSDDSYFWSSIAYAATGKFNLGLKSLEQARELYPERYVITDAIALLYTYQGKYDKAEVETKTLVAEDQPAEAKQVGYGTLSDIYAYLGRYREIVEVYDKKIGLSWATNDTARAIRHQITKANYMVYGWNDVDGAWKEAAKTVRFQESHGSRRYWSRWALQNVYSGKYTEAEETAKGVQSLIYSARGDCSKAKSLADAVLRELPGVRKALLLYRVAACQYEKGQWEEAIEALLEVQDVYTHFVLSRDLLAVFYPKSFYLLGKIYEEKADKKLAIENYEKFLNLWKDADEDLPDLIDAKKRLTKLKGGS